MLLQSKPLDGRQPHQSSIRIQMPNEFWDAKWILGWSPRVNMIWCILLRKDEIQKCCKFLIKIDVRIQHKKVKKQKHSTRISIKNIGYHYYLLPVFNQWQCWFEIAAFYKNRWSYEYYSITFNVLSVKDKLRKYCVKAFSSELSPWD